MLIEFQKECDFVQRKLIEMRLISRVGNACLVVDGRSKSRLTTAVHWLVIFASMIALDWP